MDYHAAVECIKKSSAIGITVYEKAGGDEIGSALAFASFLKRMGKKTGFLFSGQIDEKWAKIFLSPAQEHRPQAAPESTPLHTAPKKFVIAINTVKTPIAEVKYDVKGDDLLIILSPTQAPLESSQLRFLNDTEAYDCIVTIGIQSPEHFGKEFEQNPLLFYEKPLINIGLSPANELFGEINLVDITRSANAETVFELMSHLNDSPPTTLEATRLLAGLIEKTDNFQNLKTTPRILEIAAYLLEQGANKDAIIGALYKSKPLNLLQLWGRASVRSRYDEALHTLFTFLPREDFDKTGTSTRDIRFVVDHMWEYFAHPRSHAVLFENPEKNHIRVLIKSESAFLQKIAAGENGELQNGIFIFKKTFAGFPEAETYVNNLIQRNEA